MQPVSATAKEQGRPKLCRGLRGSAVPSPRSNPPQCLSKGFYYKRINRVMARGASSAGQMHGEGTRLFIQLC